MDCHIQFRSTTEVRALAHRRATALGTDLSTLLRKTVEALAEEQREAEANPVESWIQQLMERTHAEVEAGRVSFTEHDCLSDKMDALVDRLETGNTECLILSRTEDGFGVVRIPTK